MITLNTSKLEKIGISLVDLLHDSGLNECELILKLPNDYFNILDEDLFYRLNKSEDKNFIPSDSEINININGINIKIKKE